MILKTIMRYILFLFLFGCASFLNKEGLLKDNLKAKKIGIIKFTIVDAGGSDISKNCAIGYGEKGRSPYLHLNGKPHYLDLSGEMKVKKLVCLFILTTREYNFDSFQMDIEANGVYNFGEYILKYDYNEDYEKTSFFQDSPNCRQGSDGCDFVEHKANDGIVTLLDHKKLPHNLLEKEFSLKTENELDIDTLKAKNIFINKK